jgi:hypothetical protein
MQVCVVAGVDVTGHCLRLLVAGGYVHYVSSLIVIMHDIISDTSMISLSACATRFIC